MENVTLDEIAKKAGVNKSTVSKALRHSSDINNDTAEKIRQIAADLGYNPTQRLIQSTGSSMLPVHLAFYQLTPEFTHKEHYTSRMTHLLHKEFSKHGIMLFESYPQQAGDFEKLLSSGNIEALLLLGNFKFFDSSVILTFKRFVAAGKPVIFLCNYLPSEEGTFFSIRADDFTAGWQATRYCLEKNIEKIAFVRGMAWQAIVTDRRYGYLKAMEQSDNKTTAIIDYDYGSADIKDRETLSTFAGKKGEVAFVCDGDGTALRLAATLKKEYPAVFDRSTIVGINGCPDFSPEDPRDATVKISMENIAEETVNILTKMKQTGKITTGKILVDSVVIERILSTNTLYKE